MKCYLFLTFTLGGSYPHPKGCELVTAYLSSPLWKSLMRNCTGACSQVPVPKKEIRTGIRRKHPKAASRPGGADTKKEGLPFGSLSSFLHVPVVGHRIGQYLC